MQNLKKKPENMTMDLKLEGRACLVTGASSGIGRGIATMLAAEGVKLALGGRNLEALEELRSQLISRGSSDIVICTGDVATKEGVQQATASAMRALGRIDMLVNNAGGSHPIAIGKNGVNDIDDSVWDESFGLNFNAARRMTAAIAPSMIEQGWGRIVNLTGAVFAVSMNTATPAKAALQSWSKALSSQLAPHGITVNCVAPGRIHSRQIDETLHPTAESSDAYIKANIPSGYFGEPEDVASVVTFLLSPLSRYVTGGTIHIDGGLYQGNTVPINLGASRTTRSLHYPVSPDAIGTRHWNHQCSAEQSRVQHFLPTQSRDEPLIEDASRGEKQEQRRSVGNERARGMLRGLGICHLDIISGRQQVGILLGSAQEIPIAELRPERRKGTNNPLAHLNKYTYNKSTY